MARIYLVFFDPGSAGLTSHHVLAAESYKLHPEATNLALIVTLEAAQSAKLIRANRIIVRGHADLVGSPLSNQRLSLRRALGIAAELVRDGVDPAHIFIEAFGDTRPILPTARGTPQAQNRRVEILGAN